MLAFGRSLETLGRRCGVGGLGAARRPPYEEREDCGPGSGRHRPVRLVLLSWMVWLVGSTHILAQVQHLSIIQPGGFPGWPVMTGAQRGTNSVTVTWDGPSGYYQLFQKKGLKDPTWQAVGKATNLVRNATVSPLSSNAFFRVAGPSPQYAGLQTCRECHQPVYSEVILTAHTGAYTNTVFVAMGGQTNSSCLPCHTVGNRLPTGFAGKSVTPQLASVQCENCHGPAANHAANPDDPIAVPRVELAGTVCGGCHNAQFVPASVAASHPPYYEEWNASPHSVVLPELQADFLSSSGPTFYIPSCGRCHSGTVRETLLEQQPLPDGHEAGAVGITCATCHDPHQTYTHSNPLNGFITNSFNGVVIANTQLGASYTNQISYPFASTNDYFLTTSSPFTNNPDINVCAQCHNHRGATLSATDRPPHKSPQYNMLLGSFSPTDTGVSNQPASHALMELQCVRCHMQTTNYVSAQQPGVAGHSFEVQSYDTCAGCHGPPPATEVGVGLIQGEVTNYIQQIKAALDNWAATKAPASLFMKYGTRAWEYTEPGDLSPGGPGPTSAEQELIPVNIQKARFDLYLVLYDGSYGVHNVYYTFALLGAAQQYVALANQ